MRTTGRLKGLLGPAFGFVIFLWTIFWIAIYIGLLISAWGSGIFSFVLALIIGPFIIGLVQSIIAWPLIAVMTWILGDDET